MERTSNKTKLAVVNVDTWLGCRLAYHLAEKLERECKEVELHCMGRNIDHLDRLKKMKNVRLVQINYDDERSLQKAMEGINCSILLPEMREDRAKHGRNIINAMRKERVQGCLLVSVEGSNAQGLRELNSFHEIERYVQEVQWEHHYLILRKSILNQVFMLWAPAVKDQGEFPLTVDRNSQMTPLDAIDLQSSIENIVTEYCRRRHGSKGLEDTDEAAPFGGHRNKVYTLTGPAKISAEDIVRELNEATGQDVRFKQVSHDELRRYLESLKNRGWPKEEDLDADAQGGQQYAPNEATIKLILEEFDLIKRDEAGFVSGDLERIIGHRGKTPRDFFKREKDFFKGNTFKKEI